jgi:hypothetical protein
MSAFIQNDVDKFEITGMDIENSHVIFMKKIPPITYEQTNNVWCIGFAEPGIDIFGEGATKEEACRNFWDYVYDLLPSLEKDIERLTAPLKKQLDFLHEYFCFYESGRKQ